jgi:hypothetical protein
MVIKYMLRMYYYYYYYYYYYLLRQLVVFRMPGCSFTLCPF